jgi:O-antigen ligase
MSGAGPGMPAVKRGFGYEPLARPRPAITALPGWRDDLLLLALSLPVPILGVVGTYLDNGPLTLVAAGLAIVTALARPDLGLMNLVLLTPLMATDVLPAPGFDFFLVGAIVLGSVYRLPLDRPVFTLSPAFVLLAGLVVFMFFQQLPEMLAGYPGDGVRDVGSTMAKWLTALGAVLATALVTRGKSPYPYLAAILIAAAAVALLAIVTFVAPSTVAQFGGLMAETVEGDRATGVFSNPNALGLHIAMPFTLAAGWLMGWGPGRVRWVLLGVLGILAVALAIAQSRGAILTTAVALVVMGFGRSRRTGLIILILAGVIAAILIPLVLEIRVTQGAGSDVAGAWERQATSDGFRVRALLLGPELMATSPVFGIGLFHFTLETGFHPHNMFVRIFTEQGLVGVVFVVGIFIAAFMRFRRLPVMPRSIGYGFLALLLTESFFHEPVVEPRTVSALALIFTVVVTADWERGRELMRRAARSISAPGSALPARNEGQPEAT